MRFLLYARKSGESEDRQVQSIPDQLKELRALARQRGLTVVDEITESRSAKAPGQRPEFSRALERIQAGEADALLCWSINRLSRNPVDSGTLSWLLQQGKLACIQTMERAYLPEDNVLLMAVESGVANQFILDLRKAVLRGMQSKREQGVYPHRAPEGYLNNPRTRGIDPDPERFPLMRRAWELMLTGAYTVPQVRRELEAWGYRTRKARKCGGGPVSRTALYDAFNNPFYCGRFAHAGREYRGAHRAMVSEEEFERVRHLLGRGGPTRPQRHEWAFTGLIRCGACGCLVTAERKVKRYKGTGRTVAYTYYHCSGRRGCPKTSVSEAYLEGEILRVLDECRIDASAAPWLLGAVDRHFRQESGADRSEWEAHREAARRAERLLDGLVSMRAQGEITGEEFAERRAAAAQELSQARRALRGVEERHERERAAAVRVIEYCASAYERFARGGVRAKREVAAALGGRCVLTLGELHIEPRPALRAVCTFEPRENGSDRARVGDMAPGDPAWCRLLDDVRTSLAGSDGALPERAQGVSRPSSRRTVPAAGEIRRRAAEKCPPGSLPGGR